jgi:uncharacterized membrane protein HdeD (DUF308 family)
MQLGDLLPHHLQSAQPVLAQHWWVLFLRGALATAIGLAILVWPELSFAVLLLFVATWFFADAVIALLQAFTSTVRWPHALDASVSLAAGTVTVFYPAMAGIALAVTIASWFIAKGLVQVWFAIRFGGTHRGAWLFGAIGLATFGFGVFLAQDPSRAIGSLTLIFGFVIALGVSFVALGWWFER